jgi:predicted nucleotidyltransferase
MRLSTQEKNRICTSLDKNLMDISFKIFLFGSRTDDKKKGGDIDLLLQVSPKDFQSTVNKKYQLRFDLEEVLGDQRVDLTISTDEKMGVDPFLISIQPDLIKLR